MPCKKMFRSIFYVKWNFTDRSIIRLFVLGFCWGFFFLIYHVCSLLYSHWYVATDNIKKLSSTHANSFYSKLYFFLVYLNRKQKLKKAYVNISVNMTVIQVILTIRKNKLMHIDCFTFNSQNLIAIF